MKQPAKLFLIAMCILVAVGLVCIGVGIVLGGDFGEIINDILLDLYARWQGTMVEAPIQ